MIHILTGEYPPHPGGVGDYSALVASALVEQNECVHVWTGGKCSDVVERGVTVHRVAGSFFPADLARLSRALNASPGPRRILLQWTPHSFGFRSLNIFLAAWIWKRSKWNRDIVGLMIHEPFLAFGEGNWRQNAAACVHRAMIAMLLDSSSKVWMAIPAWERRLAFWNFRRCASFEWLPVPSNLDFRCDPKSVLAIRMSLAPKGQSVVGHFSSFRSDIANLLEPAIARLLTRSNIVMLLAGAGSIEFRGRIVAKYPQHGDRVVATGALPGAQIGHHLSACDTMLQPYPDGISTRRGSAMAGLALGLPLVTNIGRLSENFWPVGGAVQIASSANPDDLAESVLNLLADRDRLRQLSRIARDLYRDIFDVRHTVAALLTNRSTASRKTSKAIA